LLRLGWLPGGATDGDGCSEILTVWDGRSIRMGYRNEE